MVFGKRIRHTYMCTKVCAYVCMPFNPEAVGDEPELLPTFGPWRRCSIGLQIARKSLLRVVLVFVVDFIIAFFSFFFYIYICMCMYVHMRMRCACVAVYVYVSVCSVAFAATGVVDVDVVGFRHTYIRQVQLSQILHTFVQIISSSIWQKVNLKMLCAACWAWLSRERWQRRRRRRQRRQHRQKRGRQIFYLNKCSNNNNWA